MPRRARTNNRQPTSSNGIQQYVKLENRLVLLAWLNSLFGYERNRDLLGDVKEAGEGFDAAGRSYVCLRLEGRGDKVKIPPAALARYDDNIAQHVRAMNARRPEPVTLRYFQHLTVLYTEIFLDWYFHRRGEMLRALNRFVDQRNTAFYRVFIGYPSSLCLDALVRKATVF